MLQHFPYFNNNKWYAVYTVCGTNIFSSIGEATTKKGAQVMCDDANKEQLRQEKLMIQSAIHPADRKIPYGFYTDNE